MTTTDATTEPTTIPVVIYGVKSSPDERESVADQHRMVLAAIERENARGTTRREVIGSPHGEANTSGYQRERGPELEAAMREATSLAADHGAAELWVFHSSRLARGDGTQGRRSVAKIVHDLRYVGVTVRSVEDDPFVQPMLAGIAAEQAHKYSADLSAHVRRGKQVQLRKGEPLGGPIADGYAVARQHDAEGRVTGRTFRRDPERAPIIERIFALAADGVSDTTLARRLNAEGHRTRNGRPYDRRAVQSAITNPFYAGRIPYKRGTADEQIVPGHHPSLIEPATYDAIIAARRQRDYATPEQKRTGRPAQNHALAGLAVCGVCGDRMYAVTSNYRRKDGTRARSYQCHNYKFATGVCTSRPIDAEPIDTHVVNAMDTLLVDFDAWRSAITDRHDAERARMLSEVARAQADRDHQARKVAATEAKWGEYLLTDEAKADAVLPMVESERELLAQAERRLTATTDAYDAVPTDAPVDAMLDFATNLRRAVRGQLDDARTMAEVNAALREVFDRFVITPPLRAKADHTENPFTDRVLVMPWVREDLAHFPDWGPAIDADAAPPLLTLVAPEEKGPDSHEYRCVKWNRVAFAASQP